MDTMNAAQAGRYMKVTAQTIANWIRAGKLKAERVGDGRKPRYAIRKVDLDALLKRVVNDEFHGITEETF